MSGRRDESWVRLLAVDLFPLSIRYPFGIDPQSIRNRKGRGGSSNRFAPFFVPALFLILILILISILIGRMFIGIVKAVNSVKRSAGWKLEPDFTP